MQREADGAVLALRRAVAAGLGDADARASFSRLELREDERRGHERRVDDGEEDAHDLEDLRAMASW